MNTISKMLLPVLLCMGMLTASAQTPPPSDGEAPHAGCPMHSLSSPINLQSVKMCYVPDLGAFVAIDSTECCVHMVALQQDGTMDTVGVFTTDVTRKRHDLKNILRPVSVSAMGPYVLVLASARNDSAYVAILDSNMHELARRSFSSPMYAMHREGGALIVAGTNPYGYDINVLPLHRLDFEQFANGPVRTHHYRVAKQSERIKQSDPIGYGLTAVAVAVVFLALVCISLILIASGRLMTRLSQKEEKKPEGQKNEWTKGADEGEVYAAIAAAIHLYNDELHDDEEGIITIQKVEREWTPWNAKFYNMNKYFNNRR